MVCKNCGRPLSNGKVMCPNCGASMQTMTFQANRLGENGKRAEYITEKLTGKQGVYEGKATEKSNAYIGLILIGLILLIIIGIAIASFIS